MAGRIREKVRYGNKYIIMHFDRIEKQNDRMKMFLVANGYQFLDVNNPETNLCMKLKIHRKHLDEDGERYFLGLDKSIWGFIPDYIDASYFWFGKVGNKPSEAFVNYAKSRVDYLEQHKKEIDWVCAQYCEPEQGIVVCVEDDKEFADVNEAAKVYGLTAKEVRNSCNGGEPCKNGKNYAFITDFFDQKPPDGWRKANKKSVVDEAKKKSRPRAVRVMDVETGQIWETYQACANELGVTHQSVEKAVRKNGLCKGRRLVKAR